MNPGGLQHFPVNGWGQMQRKYKNGGIQSFEEVTIKAWKNIIRADEMDLCANFITAASFEYVSGEGTEQDKVEVERQKQRRSNDCLTIKIGALHSYQFADSNSGIIFAMENGDLFFMLPDYKMQKGVIIFRVIFGCKYSQEIAVGEQFCYLRGLFEMC